MRCGCRAMTNCRPSRPGSGTTRAGSLKWCATRRGWINPQRGYAFMKGHWPVFRLAVMCRGGGWVCPATPGQLLEGPLVERCEERFHLSAEPIEGEESVVAQRRHRLASGLGLRLARWPPGGCREYRGPVMGSQLLVGAVQTGLMAARLPDGRLVVAGSRAPVCTEELENPDMRERAVRRRASNPGRPSGPDDRCLQRGIVHPLGMQSRDPGHLPLASRRRQTCCGRCAASR